MIYSPSDDSYLLQETIHNYLKNMDKSSKVLDIGSGSGIQAITCLDLGFKDVLAIDIDKEAITHLKKQKIKAKHSDLFSELTNKHKFDLIIFNPPYLPEDTNEPMDSKLQTTAGKEGNELIIKFLRQAKSHLNKKGRILLLISSLSKPKIIKKEVKRLGYDLKLLNSKKLFFEELYVYELKL